MLSHLMDFCIPALPMQTGDISSISSVIFKSKLTPPLVPLTHMHVRAPLPFRTAPTPTPFPASTRQPLCAYTRSAASHARASTHVGMHTQFPPPSSSCAFCFCTCTSAVCATSVHCLAWLQVPARRTCMCVSAYGRPPAPLALNRRRLLLRFGSAAAAERLTLPQRPPTRPAA